MSTQYTDQPQSNVNTNAPILPEDFDGVFKFSNPSDEDFIGVWNGEKYHFPAQKTVPMIMNYSPVEIQHIRKKFAKDLAEREFFKTHKYEQLRLREGTRDEFGVVQPRGQGMQHAGSYNENDLAAIIQQCLKPLEKGKLSTSKIVKEPIENKLSRSDDGDLNTKALDAKSKKPVAESFAEKVLT